MGLEWKKKLFYKLVRLPQFKENILEFRVIVLIGCWGVNLNFGSDAIASGTYAVMTACVCMSGHTRGSCRDYRIRLGLGWEIVLFSLK